MVGEFDPAKTEKRSLRELVVVMMMLAKVFHFYKNHHHHRFEF